MSTEPAVAYTPFEAENDAVYKRGIKRQQTRQNPMQGFHFDAVRYQPNRRMQECSHPPALMSIQPL